MTRRAPVQIKTERMVLTLPPPSAAARVVRYFADNRDHFAPWDPPRPRGFYTVEFWRERLAANRREAERDASLRLFALERGSPRGPIIGTCNFTQFIRGPFQCCNLGYGLHVGHVGRGVMTEMLSAAIDHVFDTLEFHRIQANYLPHNERSAAVLERLGFRVEGYARRYLFIGGAWRDHVLTALTNPNPSDPVL